MAQLYDGILFVNKKLRNTDTRYNKNSENVMWVKEARHKRPRTV